MQRSCCHRWLFSNRARPYFGTRMQVLYEMFHIYITSVVLQFPGTQNSRGPRFVMSVSTFQSASTYVAEQTCQRIGTVAWLTWEAERDGRSLWEESRENIGILVSGRSETKSQLRTSCFLLLWMNPVDTCFKTSLWNEKSLQFSWTLRYGPYELKQNVSRLTRSNDDAPKNTIELQWGAWHEFNPCSPACFFCLCRGISPVPIINIHRCVAAQLNIYARLTIFPDNSWLKTVNEVYSVVRCPWSHVAPAQQSMVEKLWRFTTIKASLRKAAMNRSCLLEPNIVVHPIFLFFSTSESGARLI